MLWFTPSALEDPNPWIYEGQVTLLGEAKFVRYGSVLTESRRFIVVQGNGSTVLAHIDELSIVRL